MMYMLIKATNYSLSPRRFIAGTKGSYGIETLDFEFSNEWDGLAVTVTFFPSGESGEAVTAVFSRGTPILLPSEVTAEAGIVKYTVNGYCDEKRLVSVTGYIDVLNAETGEGKNVSTPTASEMSQVLTMMNTAVSVAQSVRDDADNGNFDGADIERAELDDAGCLIFSRSDGVTLNAGNVIEAVYEALGNGDEVSY